MKNPSTSFRSRRLLFGTSAGILLLAIAVFFWPEEKAGGGPGGYVIARDAETRAGNFWFTSEVRTSRSFAAGKNVKIATNSRALVVRPDGRIEEVTGPRTLKLEAHESSGETLENFLAVSLEELAGITPGGTGATAGDVRILSPVGVTRFTNPTVTWASRPGADYDVAIVDPADPMAPPRLARAVRPPVTIEQLQSPQRPRLQADRLYEAHVREAGSTLMVGLARFLVAKDAAEGALPAEPADLLREAVAAMAKKPTRTGDAWLALAALPEDWAAGELAVRLRLRVSAELGLMNEFVRAQEAAWLIVKNRR